MSIRYSDRGSELAPDCTWLGCSLFELPPDRTVLLQPNGEAEQWMLVRGHALATGNGAARRLDAPEALQLPPGTTLQLQMSGPAILLLYHPVNGRASA